MHFGPLAWSTSATRCPRPNCPISAGKLHALGSLYGQKLTVVCFWTIGARTDRRLVANAVLEDLMKDVAEPFGEKGVRVIGINVGDPAAPSSGTWPRRRRSSPTCWTRRANFFAKIAKDKRMPRTFLLDAGGKILWFDVEYSRASRHDLVQASSGVGEAMIEPIAA